MDELPNDLYIPPEALRVFLDSFEGPLDLLLYLIRRQNLEIVAISVSSVTEQYMAYVNLMEAHQFELAAEYLVMAATLAEIKSRVLLPRSEEEGGDEADPRMDLAKRLQIYAQFRDAAERIDALPRLGRDVLPVAIERENIPVEVVHPDLTLDALQDAFREVLKRAELFEGHHITPEVLSTRERMGSVLSQLEAAGGYVSFYQLFSLEEGRAGVVVSFCAMLELVKEGLVDIVQNTLQGAIYLGKRQEQDDVELA